MLDTNIISDLVKNPSGAVYQKVKAVGPDAICTSAIVVSEIRYGLAKKSSAELRKRIEDVLNEFPVMPYAVPADFDYGSIRAGLEAAGQLIGSVDIFIAAHAKALSMTLVTDNVREFGRVPGLTVENWLR